MPKVFEEKLTWKGHKRRWSSCEDCELCETRNKVVLGRGKIPCDILFIGEAPGAAENVLGHPFIGPAGHLLDRIIAHSVPKGLRLAFTNLVGCIPLEGGSKAKGPPRGSIEACSDRLKEFVQLARPKAIVCVGKLTAKYLLDDEFFIDHSRYMVEILHPAYILRADESQKGLAVQRCEVVLEDLVGGCFSDSDE
jgi:DNA polymerase|tara:strand:- start:3016 stop:3597 length:582 start_codon:yes stop_codon:yes gene_type:complete